MGGGSWDHRASEARTQARAHAPQQKTFQQTKVHDLMSINGLTVRESRDSAEHPNSRAIAFIVDSTGSMGDIPHGLAARTLPTFMRLVLPFEPDAQILFGAVQDYENGNGDNSCQIGQFESDDALADQWLTRIHIGGGGRPSEGYDIGLFVASQFFKMDCLEKRGKKGYLFVTGDDTVRDLVDYRHVNELLGRTQLEHTMRFADLVRQAQQKFHIFFLIPDPTRVGWSGDGTNVLDCWRCYLGHNVIVAGHPDDTALVSAMLIGLTDGHVIGEAGVEQQLRGLDIHPEQTARVVKALQPYVNTLAAAE